MSGACNVRTSARDVFLWAHACCGIGDNAPTQSLPMVAQLLFELCRHIARRIERDRFAHMTDEQVSALALQGTFTHKNTVLLWHYDGVPYFSFHDPAFATAKTAAGKTDTVVRFTAKTLTTPPKGNPWQNAASN